MTNISVEELSQLVKQDRTLKEELKSAKDVETFANTIDKMLEERGVQIAPEILEKAIEDVSNMSAYDGENPINLADNWILAAAGASNQSIDPLRTSDCGTFRPSVCIIVTAECCRTLISCLPLCR